MSGFGDFATVTFEALGPSGVAAPATLPLLATALLTLATRRRQRV